MIKYTGANYLNIPQTLIEKYQPVIGPVAAMVWINLLYLSKEQVSQWEEPLLALTGLAKEELITQLEILEEADLIEVPEKAESGVKVLLKEPKADLPEAETAAAELIETKEPTAPQDPALDENKKKLEALYDYYHERIGLMSAMDFPLLNEWMEVRGMSPELIAKAIEVTSENAQFPSMKYLDGVLKNWYNAGIRTVSDLEKNKLRQPKGDKPAKLSSEAAAVPQKPIYKDVDIEKVRKWKELFKDDYNG